MEVTITQFRKQLFTLVERAMQGTEVWVTHKGRRFKLTPDEQQPVSKLDRLTPMKIINVDVPESRLWEEMSKAWEKDWDELM
jgi:prevent-host-death family protein